MERTDCRHDRLSFPWTNCGQNVDETSARQAKVSVSGIACRQPPRFFGELGQPSRGSLRAQLAARRSMPRDQEASISCRYDLDGIMVAYIANGLRPDFARRFRVPPAAYLASVISCFLMVVACSA